MPGLFYRYMKQFDVILLPGLRLRPDGSPRHEMGLRVQKAFEVWKETKALRIIACGADTAGTGVSEAETMKRMLVQKGVPEECVLTEDASFITAENFRNAVSALDELTECFQVLHICGNGNTMDLYERHPGYVQEEYLNDEMADALACADVVVSRAGSNSICELLALRKPALLIPYPTAASRGDQEVNAESFERRGFSRVLEQNDLTSETLVKRIIEVYHDRGELIECMNREPVVNGSDRIVECIYRYAAKK